MAGAEQIIGTLQRDLNCLADSDRSTRRRALERLHKQLLQGETNHYPNYLEDLQFAWDDTILKNVLKALSDSVEKCRELAIHLINGVMSRIPKVDQTVALLVPLIAQRMGQVPLIEGSEEIRLQIINFISSGCMVRCSEDTLKLVAQQLTQVLCISLGDKFHEIKKGASRAIVMFTQGSSEVFNEMSEQLLRALLPNIGHTHSKVRLATLEAINSVVLCGLPAGMVADVLVPAIRVLALDRTIGVREVSQEKCGFSEPLFDSSQKVLLSLPFASSCSCYQVQWKKSFFVYVAGWLGYATDTNCTENQKFHKDELDPRAYASQLLPLLLLGLSDESADVAEKALHLVEGVGEVYMKFEFPAKDEIAKTVDDTEEEAKSNPWQNSAGLELPPPYKGRPGKGCRMMVQAYIGQLIYPVQKDLKQWTSNVRLVAARLLHALLILAEEKAADYLDTLVPCLCSAVGDDESAVAQHAIKVAHVLGYHILPDYWLPLVLGQVTPSRMSQEQVANGLIVLAGLLYGTPTHAVKESTVIKLTKQIYDANLGFNDHPAIKQQVLAVLHTTIEKGGALCKSSSLEICLLLLQLQSLDGDSKTQQLASPMVDNLAWVIGLNSGKDLYARHAEAIIAIITNGHAEWTGTSSGAFLFRTFLENAGSCVGPYLGTLLPVFSDCLNADRDPVLRLSLVPVLDKLFEVEELAVWWRPLALHTIGGILLPCSVWHIGKVAAAIRHEAMVALGTFLRQDLCSQEHLGALLCSQQLLSIVTSCLEEDYYTDTRHVSCHVIEHIIRIVGIEFSEEQVTTVSKSLQKRLDDSSDIVRLAILPAISKFLVTSSLSNRNIDGFLSNLILHMDDPDEKIEEGVYSVIKDYASEKPEVVLEVGRRAQERIQNIKHCDQLLEFASSKLGGVVQ